MSWDACVTIETGAGNYMTDDGVGCLNYTHNCNGMLRQALRAVGHLDQLGDRNLYNMDGMGCSAVVELLEPALDWWRSQPPGTMDDLLPDNGWGNEQGALGFWSSIVRLCREHPKATLVLSG